MPSNGVFIAVGELLGKPVRDGVHGTRSGKVGAGVALRIGQDLCIALHPGGSDRDWIGRAELVVVLEC